MKIQLSIEYGDDPAHAVDLEVVDVERLISHLKTAIDVAHADDGGDYSAYLRADGERVVRVRTT
jgi:hypothetical protein